MANSLGDFLTGLQLRHFSAYELSYLGASHQDNGLNSLPSPHLWRNVVQVAWLADMARERLGRPLRILSGYRNPAYNAAVGGVSGSIHLQYRALDLDPLGVPTQDLFDLLHNWRGSGVFRGGLGLYKNFVHVDTRGSNATWGV